MTTVPILLGFNGSNYQVTRSLRFRSSASAYLNRTFGTPTNNKIWTYSLWVKRGKLGAEQELLNANSVNSQFYFSTSDTLNFYDATSGATYYSTQVFRDPSAWYHILVAEDTTQATAGNRVKLYVNGVQITSFSTGTAPTQNNSSAFNAASTIHTIGRYNPTTTNYLDGYLAEVNFIDGQALTPSSFGYFDLYGVWQPKKYNGTFGTNGFYLPFSNTTSTTTLTADSSGNGNNWTANNISLTAGATYDSMIDSPTNYADGGTGRGNYAVLNPLSKNGVQNGTYTTATISNGNLLATGGAINTLWSAASSMVLPTTGKWYFEVTMSATAFGNGAAGLFSLSNSSANCYARLGTGAVLNGSTSYAYTGYNTGSTNRIGIAYDADNNKYWQTDVSGTWLNSKTPGVDTTGLVSGLTAAGDYVVGWWYNSGGESNLTASVNFGQQPFSYTQPSGFNALNTQNLPPSAVPYGAPYMNAITYTGYGPLVPSGLGILTKRNASTQNVSKSLRFRASASAYLNRTNASNGNLNTWTISFWIKRGASITGSNQCVIGTSYTSLSEIVIRFNSDDTFRFEQYASGGTTNLGTLVTSQVFRDPSAWYHFTIIFDSSNATASSRVRLYVNGTQVTAFSSATYPAQNANSIWNNNANTQFIGKYSTAQHFDGYLAEVNFIDGQALTPSSFGQTNSDGIWVPKAYTGTYGTNGFYLPFTNTTSTTTLVADSSGNGNNWTPNNISLTAGTTYDSMIDSPTDYASAGNYAVFNPLNVGASGAPTFSNANLNVSTPASGFGVSFATIGVSSGKWYWEVTALTASANNNYLIGVANSAATTGNFLGSDANGWSYWGFSGVKYNNGTSTAYGATFTANDVIGVALDMDAGTLTFYKNGTSQGTAFTGLTGTLYPSYSDGSGSTDSTTAAINFGQRPFTYSAPSGHSTLNTYNITAPSTTWFSSANNSGNASATAYPDFVWIKSRSSAQNHSLNDTLRGATLNLVSNSTAAEAGLSTMFAVNKYGLTLGNDASVNSASATDVMWGWQGGNGVTSTNTNGTITSTVSASTTSGVSIVTYTGTGVSNATVGHGLGVTPSMVIVKPRASATDNNWRVKHSSLSSNNNLALNLTDAQFNVVTSTNGGIGDLSSSSTFTLVNGTTTNNNVNQSGITYIAYCFAAIRGFSAFGSYTGNGSADGPFVYTGFRPRWVMIKSSSAIGDWAVQDSSRSTYNAANALLWPDLTNAEYTTAGVELDYLSNGFKIRNTNALYNGSGTTYIYAAFAENPFNMSRAR